MRRPWLALAGICALALLLRAGWILYRWTHGGLTLDYPDEELHWQLATHLVRDGTLVSDDGRFAARMPLYPLYLALFAWIGPAGILAARLGQAVLGAIATGVVARWTFGALGYRAALVVGLLVGCDPFAIFFANLLLTETLFGLLLVLLLAHAWRACTTPILGLIGVALCGAAAVLTRPAAAGLLPLLWLLILALAADRRRVLRWLPLCAVVLLAALWPWGLRNRAVLGACAWLSTNGGATLYDAQGPQADGSSNQAFQQNLPELATLGEVARDRTLQRLAVEQMQRDPARVLSLARDKLLRTWSPLPNVAEYHGGWAAWTGAAYTIVVVGGALAGLARRPVAPPNRRLLALLWLAVVYFTLVHCTYVGSVRYRVPLMPLLAVAAGTCVRDPQRSA